MEWSQATNALPAFHSLVWKCNCLRCKVNYNIVEWLQARCHWKGGSCPSSVMHWSEETSVSHLLLYLCMHAKPYILYCQCILMSFKPFFLPFLTSQSTMCTLEILCCASCEYHEHGCPVIAIWLVQGHCHHQVLWTHTNRDGWWCSSAIH